MAIMFVRAQVIGRGAGRSIVSAAAYRHRTKMIDEQAGTTFRYEGGASEMVHEELALPKDTPAWLRAAIEGRSVAGASEALWNAVEAFEKRADAQLARELIIALPEELTRAQNIALVREFVSDNFTSRGMTADWVYHDKDGNPHIHLMTTLRSLTEEGFGPKKVPVIGEDGEALRVGTPDRPKGKIVYRLWAGDKETMKAWKIAWAETVNRHLALAGHDIRLDGRSYAEQGLDGIAQKHLGPEKAALARKGKELFFAPAELARRQEMADRLLADPELLLRQLGNERSTFDERDIAKALHRYVDDPMDFANIRAKLMMSGELVLLKPQEINLDTGKVAEPAIFTTRDILRVEYDMAHSAAALSKRHGFAVAGKRALAAIERVEARDPERLFRFDAEQVEAVRHVTRDSGIAAVVGLAGAGKSTLLEAARMAWESDGRRVLGAALAGKAAEGLEDSSGIKSRTLASFELAWAVGRETLNRGDVLVIDEAGMVSSQQMARVLKVAETAGAKVVLVGDAMQLQPIQAGAAFRAIVERIGFAELAGVRRQRQQWARDASRLFARGEVERALDLYATHGRITETQSRDEAIRRIVADWMQARMRRLEGGNPAHGNTHLHGDDLIVLAHTNADVKRLNEALRAVMIEQGFLSEQHAFMTERGRRDFAVGDRIIFLENARLVESHARHLGPQYVKNGMLGTVTAITDKRGSLQLSIRLDSGRDVVFGEESYRNIDHGYAATIHKSQGATVERTFVLATGMMDRHLTYVAMTRHRDRVDLYAAREDFEQRSEWGQRPRIDHAVGITGELVDIGAAKFREGEDADPSPYADVKTDDGKTHRLWGVSLPKAIEDGGVDIGDTVALCKDGVEQVTIKVPVIDEETGKRRYEQRAVQRNIWTAKQIETVEVREARIKHESHRPDLFNQLVERLSRSGAKTTTLDFESEAGYQAHASDFARRRGITQLAEVTSEIEAAVSRRLVWLSEKRDQVARLWERASIALGFAIEKERSMIYNDDKAVSQSVERTETTQRKSYWLEPATSFPRSLREDARLLQMESSAWKEREAFLHSMLETIYRDPDRALTALNEKVSENDADPKQLAKEFRRSPDILGRLRGSELLVDGRAARDERSAAIAALTALMPLVRAHAEAFRKDAEAFVVREQKRRSYMLLSVPALSEKALARLGEAEAVHERGGESAYKAALSYASQDRSVVQEIKAVNEALTARFGWSAFTAKADAIAARNIVERMPEDLTTEKREELMLLFVAVKRFAEEQYHAERLDRSRVVAAASADRQKEHATVLPMLAAVTEFRLSVEEEARNRALTDPYYRQQCAALAETATRVWRDPVSAVRIIENLVVKSISAERLVAAVSNNPSAYGALRGSGKMMDRLLAAGRERKEAMEAIGNASTHIKKLASSYMAAFEAESLTVTEERRRIAIAIPGLSQPARNALVDLTIAAKGGKRLEDMVAALDPKIRDEFAVIGKALDARFGRGVTAHSDNDVANLVPPAQRRAFEAMRESLKILQSAVRIDGSQKIIAERNIRAFNQPPLMKR